MYRGLQAKAQIMRQYPDVGLFVTKAYYEKDPEVCGEVQKIIERYAAFQTNAGRLKLDPEQFKPGMDLKMMYQEMYWASVGYLWEKVQSGVFDADQIEQDFAGLIAFWKKMYLRKEGEV